LKLTVIILTCLLSLAPGAMAENLVTNGGFETGDFTGWTVEGLVTDCQHGLGASGVVANGAKLPCASTSQYVMTTHSGSYATALSTFHSVQDVYLRQTLTTAPGASYIINIYLANCLASATCFASSNHFQVQWDGKVLFDQYNVGSNYGNGYSLYTFHVTASGPTTPFAIGGYNNGDWFFLDDISISSIWGVGASPPFTGSPKAADCIGKTVSELTLTYGGLAKAVVALGYATVSDLERAVVGYCGR
jgi:hypothetical protein